MLDDPSLVKHVDHICFLNRTQSMSNGDGGAALRGSIQGCLDDLFGLRVESRGGFVEEENSGVADESAGNGDTLFLA